MAALRAHASQLEGAGPDTYLTAPGFLAEVEARSPPSARHRGRFGEGYRQRGPVAVRDARALLGEPS